VKVEELPPPSRPAAGIFVDRLGAEKTMKKSTLVVACAFSILAATAFAQELDQPVKVAVDISKNGEPLWKGSLSGAVGREFSFFSTSESIYVSDCTPNATGGFDTTVAKATNGTIVLMEPLSENVDGVVLKIYVRYSEPAIIREVKTVYGCTVGLPNQDWFETTTTAVLKRGEALNLPAAKNGVQYQVHVQTI